MAPDPRPLLALTLGDPAGIGPEVVLKVLMGCRLQARARLRVATKAGGFGGTAALVQAAVLIAGGRPWN